jgi:hypothetical protein
MLLERVTISHYWQARSDPDFTKDRFVPPFQAVFWGRAQRLRRELFM